MHSLADYEKLPEGAPFELINGDLVREPAPVPYHQSILLELSFAMLAWVKKHNYTPGHLYPAPVDVVLSEYNVVQPDLVFVATDSRSRVGEKRIEGPPDLVVEILSPSNALIDLWEKRLLYEQFGVREYWIVDPQRQRVEVYENVDTTFLRFEAAEKEGQINSKVLTGFSIDIQVLF